MSEYEPVDPKDFFPDEHVPKFRAAMEKLHPELDIVVPNLWVCEEGDNTGFPCVYDRESDPALDSCIYCGDPYERK